MLHRPHIFLSTTLEGSLLHFTVSANFSDFLSIMEILQSFSFFCTKEPWVVCRDRGFPLLKENKKKQPPLWSEPGQSNFTQTHYSLDRELHEILRSRLICCLLDIFVFWKATAHLAMLNSVPLEYMMKVKSYPLASWPRYLLGILDSSLISTVSVIQLR